MRLLFWRRPQPCVAEILRLLKKPDNWVASDNLLTLKGGKFEAYFRFSDKVFSFYYGDSRERRVLELKPFERKMIERSLRWVQTQHTRDLYWNLKGIP